jgi:hypothetical protein
VTLGTVSSHHVLKRVGSWSNYVSWGSKCSQDRIWFHTPLANGHNRDRCKHVSKGPLHSTQWSWWGHPLFCRFSTIRIFFLHKNPYEYFPFVFRLSLPNEVAFEDAIWSFELNPIRGASGIGTICSPSPNDGVPHARLQVDGLDSDPKGGKFLNVLSGAHMISLRKYWK